MKNELWLTWKEPYSRRRYKVGVLSKEEKNYIFKYENPELDAATEKGFKYFPGFEDTKKVYKNEVLFMNIKTRLPNVSRPDYLEILNSYNLEKDSNDFDILKATRGRLITDDYEFVPAFDLNKIEFDIAGTRHCHDINKCKKILKINDKLLLAIDSDNEFDNNAIKVMYNDGKNSYHLGYVPRYYAKQLSEKLQKGMNYSAMIKSLNFDSPLSDENITASVKLIFDI